MRLAAGTRPAMARMFAAVVFDDEFLRREGGCQLGPDRVGHRHASSVSSDARRKSSATFSCFFTLPPHNSAMAAKESARFTADIRIKPDAPRPEPSKRVRPCDRPNCGEEGAYKVTRS